MHSRQYRADIKNMRPLSSTAAVCKLCGIFSPVLLLLFYLHFYSENAEFTYLLIFIFCAIAPAVPLFMFAPTWKEVDR